MEPLWSPVVSTGGNQWQIRATRTAPKQARTVAVGCDRLPERFHGKEGSRFESVRGLGQSACKTGCVVVCLGATSRRGNAEEHLVTPSAFEKDQACAAKSSLLEVFCRSEGRRQRPTSGLVWPLKDAVPHAKPVGALRGCRQRSRPASDRSPRNPTRGPSAHLPLAKVAVWRAAAVAEAHGGPVEPSGSRLRAG